MKLSTKGRYAVMAVVDLASATGHAPTEKAPADKVSSVLGGGKTSADANADADARMGGAVAGENSSPCAVSLAVIAERQGISRPYLEQLFMRLRRAELVRSVRGAKGGYQLARSADDIAIADIVLAVDEPIRATRCAGLEGKGCLVRGGRCQTHDLWSALGQHIASFLSAMTVADVLRGDVAGRSGPGFGVGDGMLDGSVGTRDAGPRDGGTPDYVGAAS